MANSRSRKSGVSRRGFASMNPKRLRAISAKGGRSSHGGGRPASR